MSSGVIKNIHKKKNKTMQIKEKMKLVGGSREVWWVDGRSQVEESRMKIIKIRCTAFSKT